MASAENSSVWAVVQSALRQRATRRWAISWVVMGRWVEVRPILPPPPDIPMSGACRQAPNLRHLLDLGMHGPEIGVTEGRLLPAGVHFQGNLQSALRFLP